MVRVRIQDRPYRLENYEVFEERNKKWMEELEIKNFNLGKTPGKKMNKNAVYPHWRKNEK
ncbi:MAG: hypothetical protein EAX87_14920 [Candidatus Thorarchaeota archaeon]|nr:hypothetical protein [Candidatus Thorarchaeota archaeon]